MNNTVFPATTPEYDSDVMTEVEDSTEKSHNVTVFNDEYNSFDHVIGLLVQYCLHEWAQAEQCAHFIHNKGSYAVKNGCKAVMEGIADALCVNGLDARVETNE